MFCTTLKVFGEIELQWEGWPLDPPFPFENACERDGRTITWLGARWFPLGSIRAQRFRDLLPGPRPSVALEAKSPAMSFC